MKLNRQLSSGLRRSVADDVTQEVDPRVRRSRVLLQTALTQLMQTRSFGKISVLDIAEAATLNRATFYDHYADKFALLDDVVADRFDELLARRGVAFDGSCACALSSTILAVCDYLASVPSVQSTDRSEAQSHLEAAIVAVVKRTVLAGMNRQLTTGAIAPEMIASAVGWAAYGAAKEWLLRPGRCESHEIVPTIARLIAPLLADAVWLHSAT